MSEEESLPEHLEYNQDEQNFKDTENDISKQTNKNECDKVNSDINLSKEIHKENNIQIKEGLKEDNKITNDEFCIKSKEETDLLQEIDELDDHTIIEKIKCMPENELLGVLKEIENENFYLSKENEIYEFILNDDETFQSIFGKAEEVDQDIAAPESFELSYPIKYYLAEKKLEHAEKVLKQKNGDYALEIQNLKFELESLNKTLRDIHESKEKFEKDIRIDGRHPVTKKIILQKVAKYFDDSIRIKMDLANRYKIQIQGDIMEQNKILSQIKAQEKRLAFLNITEFQEVQFEYKKSCRELAMYKEQLGKYKAKFSFLLQNITKLKKDLEREESDMEQMKNAVIKLEHRKETMLSEKARNEEKVIELKAAMKKIRHDPRRHYLPEVIDYAATKKENSILTKNVEKWKKKVENIQQEKLSHLDALAKRRGAE